MVLESLRLVGARARRRDLQTWLRRGGVVAYPTESCFGLGCLPGQRQGLQRLLRLKQRPKRKGLIVIGANRQQLQPWCAPRTVQEWAQLQSSWPGPNTWLLPHAPRAPRLLTGRHASLAVRVPGLDSARALCWAMGSALVSTSANRSGRASLRHARAVQRQFGTQVKVLAGRVGARRQPSTIRHWPSGQVVRG